MRHIIRNRSLVHYIAFLLVIGDVVRVDSETFTSADDFERQLCYVVVVQRTPLMLISSQQILEHHHARFFHQHRTVLAS